MWGRHCLAGLIVATCWLASATADDGPCVIGSKYGMRTATCRGEQLNYLPSNIPEDILVLDFSGNQLSYLGDDQFAGYSDLQEIDLSHNAISSITETSFGGLKKVHILRLNGNQLSGIPSGAFEQMRFLRLLNLSDNPIQHVQHEAFSQLTNMNELHIAGCQVDRIHARAFEHLLWLDSLDLSGNRLRGLSPDMLNYMPPRLRVFRIYDNPWMCDCNLAWLIRWLERQRVIWHFAVHTPRCAGPKVFKDSDWLNLLPDQFVCTDETRASDAQTIHFFSKPHSLFSSVMNCLVLSLFSVALIA